MRTKIQLCIIAIMLSYFCMHCHSIGHREDGKPYNPWLDSPIQSESAAPPAAAALFDDIEIQSLPNGQQSFPQISRLPIITAKPTAAQSGAANPVRGLSCYMVGGWDYIRPNLWRITMLCHVEANFGKTNFLIRTQSTSLSPIAPSVLGSATGLLKYIAMDEDAFGKRLEKWSEYEFVITPQGMIDSSRNLSGNLSGRIIVNNRINPTNRPAHIVAEGDRSGLHGELRLGLGVCYGLTPAQRALVNNTNPDSQKKIRICGGAEAGVSLPFPRQASDLGASDFWRSMGMSGGIRITVHF